MQLADWLGWKEAAAQEDVELVEAVAKAIWGRPSEVPTTCGLWSALYGFHKHRIRRDAAMKALATRAAKKRRAAAEVKKRGA